MKDEETIRLKRDELVKQMKKGGSGYDIVGAVKILNWILEEVKE